MTRLPLLLLLASCTTGQATFLLHPWPVLGGGKHMWVIDPSGALHCISASCEGWEVPEGRYRMITDEANITCAIDEDGALVCWGTWYEGDAPTDGPFTQVALGRRFGCALREDGEVRCWGDVEEVNAQVPPGPWVQVVTDHVGSACALSPEGRVQCWGERSWEQPTEHYTHIAASLHVSCGVQEDTRVDCWDGSLSNEPVWFYDTLDFSGGDNCALMTDGSIRCFGTNQFTDYWQPPEGEFVDLALGNDCHCATTVDEEVICWGEEWLPDPDWGQDP